MSRFKVKAGALQLTMFIVVVIALLLAAFIVLIHTHKQFKVQTSMVLETIENTNKGIHYTLHNSIPTNDTINVNLQDEDYKVIKVHRDYWGIFEKVTTVSTIKNKTFKKVALIGAEQSVLERTALYIEDNNRPLVVVGSTRIEGLSYLPKQGVRTGNIPGHSYYGTSLIYGTTKTSDNQLPKIDSKTLEHIETDIHKINTINQDQFIDISKSKSHQNSFLNPMKVVYSKSDIHLMDVSLIGHIMVTSETKIIIDTTSNLKDIILIAPKIALKNNVKGTFQGFATEEITVGNNCKLSYPSALILNENKQTINSTNTQKESSSIKINKNVSIKGIVSYVGITKNYKPQIFIDENTTIIGEVYCNRNLELLGRVYGSVFTSSFVASQSGSVYQNHIYNGIISSNELPEPYVGLSFENSKKGIAKWLY